MEKGIKAYHSYLSFGDAKEALSETVCEDLNLDDLCEQLDYTSSCVGRQYLYHILCTDKISDVTAHEQFIEQLQTDYLLRNKLVNALQKDAEPVQKITIVPRTMGALGYVMQVPEEEKYLNTKKELEAMLVGYLGGRAAEEIVFDTVTTGAANDIEQATKVARAMITQYGMSEKFGLMGLATQENQYLSGRAVLNCGDDTATEIDHEVMKLLHYSYEEARRILGNHRAELDKIAEYLIRKETITGKEFMKILRAVQQGLDIPENLEDLVLSEDKKEVFNKQDSVETEVKSESDTTAVAHELQAAENSEMQSSDAQEKTETEEKPGSQA